MSPVTRRTKPVNIILINILAVHKENILIVTRKCIVQDLDNETTTTTY